jgi:hypothetical protein
MDVLIVGAGLTGLLAAQALRRRNLSVLVVEKSRSVGGRLATRRIGPGQADTGAQFLTARTPAFQQMAADWEARGLTYVWSHGWADSAGQPQMDGHPRYAVHGGMNGLAQELAQTLAVQVNVRISGLSPVRAGWQVTDTEGRIYAARGVLLTAPVPQSLTFLETGRTPVPASDLAVLRAIGYSACLAGVFLLDRPSRLPEPGALQALSPKVIWAADNQRKGISPGGAVLTVHASPEFSHANYDAPSDQVIAALLKEVKPWLGPAQVQESYLKRWRYAQPLTSHVERSLTASGVPPLVFAGDAFGDPRLEGAALSGLAAAETLAGLLA